MQFAILPLFADTDNGLIFSTGLGGEATGSSRDNLAAGGLLQADFRLWGGFSLGVKGEYGTNFDSIDDSVQTLDIKAFLRIYPLDFFKLHAGVFLQGEMGRLFAWESVATTKHAAGEMVSGWSYGGTVGARFAFPPGEYGNFYLEPFARMGVPILWSGGIVAGYSFHSSAIYSTLSSFVYKPAKTKAPAKEKAPPKKQKSKYVVFTPAHPKSQNLPQTEENHDSDDIDKEQYSEQYTEQFTEQFTAPFEPYNDQYTEPYTEPYTKPYTDQYTDQYNKNQVVNNDIVEPRIVERYIIESQEIIAVEYHHNDIKLAVRDGEPYEFSIAEVFFYKDSASFFGLKRDVVRQNKKILDMVAEFLIAHPSYRLCVEGHANPTTKEYSAARNREELQALQPLSLKRAEKIADMLVARGVNVSRLYIRGNGAEETVVPLEDKEGWWKNRRAEFTLYR
jgi:outer membrane protein OmpA-like peptidoglycan-associated protein